MPYIDLGPVVGPKGDQGATGAQGIRGEQGLPGPNQVTNSTATPLTGVLTGNGSVVGVASIDEAPTTNSTGFATSGGTDKAIKGRVPVYGKGVNLLRNWCFIGGGTGKGVFPVNSRGSLSYTTSGEYCIDSWKLYRGTAVLSATGLTITRTDSSSYAPIHQKVDDYGLYAGNMVTFSVFLDSQTFYSDTFMLPGSGSYMSSQYGSIRLYANASSQAVEIGVVTLNASVKVQAAKLEVGTEQTLCHNEGTAESPVWVLNDVPDYGYELYRCLTSTADSSDTYANKSLATEEQIATPEWGTTASRAYAVGEFFCKGGLFYRVTAAISNGDSFNVGTNCEPTTIAGTLRTSKMFRLSHETGTTSALGNLDLSISPYAIIVGFRPSTQQAIAFYGRGSTGNYFCNFVTSAGSTLANTAVSVDVYYVDA